MIKKKKKKKKKKNENVFFFNNEQCSRHSHTYVHTFAADKWSPKGSPLLSFGKRLLGKNV